MHFSLININLFDFLNGCGMLICMHILLCLHRTVIKLFLYYQSIFLFRVAVFIWAFKEIFGLFVQLLCILCTNSSEMNHRSSFFCCYIIPWNFSITFSVRGQSLTPWKEQYHKFPKDLSLPQLNSSGLHFKKYWITNKNLINIRKK